MKGRAFRCAAGSTFYLSSRAGFSPRDLPLSATELFSTTEYTELIGMSSTFSDSFSSVNSVGPVVKAKTDYRQLGTGNCL